VFVFALGLKFKKKEEKNLPSQNGIKTQAFIFYICLYLISSSFGSKFWFFLGGAQKREKEREEETNDRRVFFCCLLLKFIMYTERKWAKGRTRLCVRERKR
jgi:hypothetical protein